MGALPRHFHFRGVTALLARQNIAVLRSRGLPVQHGFCKFLPLLFLTLLQTFMLPPPHQHVSRYFLPMRWCVLAFYSAPRVGFEMKCSQLSPHLSQMRSLRTTVVLVPRISISSFTTEQGPGYLIWPPNLLSKINPQKCTLTNITLQWLTHVLQTLLLGYNAIITYYSYHGLGSQLLDTMTTADVKLAVVFENVLFDLASVGLLIAKASLIAFLMRLVPQHHRPLKWRTLIIGPLVLLVVVSFGSMLAYWERCFTELSGETLLCDGIDAAMTWMQVAAATSVGVDLWYAAMPWYLLRRLTRPRKEKWLVQGSMSLGVIAAGCGIARTLSIYPAMTNASAQSGKSIFSPLHQEKLLFLCNLCSTDKKTHSRHFISLARRRNGRHHDLHRHARLPPRRLQHAPRPRPLNARRLRKLAQQ